MRTNIVAFLLPIAALILGIAIGMIGSGLVSGDIPAAFQDVGKTARTLVH